MPYPIMTAQGSIKLITNVGTNIHSWYGACWRKCLDSQLWGVEMTFEGKWKQVERLNILPNTAIRQIPQILSEKTKSFLVKKTAQEIAGIVNSAVYEIVHGSVETVNTLVLKRV